MKLFFKLPLPNHHHNEIPIIALNVVFVLRINHKIIVIQMGIRHAVHLIQETKEVAEQRILFFCREGNLLPAFHSAGGFRIPPPRGVLPRWGVCRLRVVWETSADDGVREIWYTTRQSFCLYFYRIPRMKGIFLGWGSCMACAR